VDGNLTFSTLRDTRCSEISLFCDVTPNSERLQDRDCRISGSPMSGAKGMIAAGFKVEDTNGHYGKPLSQPEPRLFGFMKSHDIMWPRRVACHRGRY
jgi:hypothetical protein